MTDSVPIAFGITDLDVGGAERMLAELVTRLDRRRWSPSVVSLQPCGPLASKLIRHDIPVESLEMGGTRDLPAALRRWTTLLRERPPALLQTFLVHANILGRLAGTWAKVPVIVSGVRVAEQRKRAPMWLDRLTHRLASAHVCVSDDVLEHTHRVVGIPRNRLLTIPNGVDLNMIDRRTPVDLEPFGASGRPVLVTVGRLDHQKGIDLLLDALRKLRLRAAIPMPLTVIVGDGPDRERYVADADDLGDDVRFVGWQPNPLDWMAAGDCFVLASRWEGMPNVVLEAMACRRPIITTSVEGIRRLVEAGRTGWVVPTESSEALARAIEDWLTDPERAIRFGEAGRDVVEGRYRIEAMIERYDALYRSLITR
ncbi:Alpha-D-kanosaminyltransferase [Planctomycetes bacterium Pan216]|uniref:Alpha-D-kanosaminyltransferase n=1 Tax=Kolteria novifilia TaxID=2527975 RepID=A0A518B9B7_9BACT|nr:Alpha-D-kanosaminyltransferase [Planctomycetes bacterium Pan216]